MRGFYTTKIDGQHCRDPPVLVTPTESGSIQGNDVKRWKKRLTFALFLVAPALLWGKGAGVAFLPCLGGCH